ncbi:MULTISPECIES: type I-B CRISPR-associated protein Cas7/Cst2/DevR [unclassified Methanoculleus]|uniref:type I-B CRISPR-associated protein Cas7/Cst2/DevR n=1 Tax=unclassified Methanoculleus TaxID=2619537 RepID=UPI0025D431F1|nr:MULTISPECIES: type I-B CRISPR-associated protein Cas7/Cst2/DevR [unclassified Methanoculleus]
MKTIIGAYLIDAPFSALNNRGIDPRAANENEVATKTINSPEGVRPYVSAQALRYWWRQVLKNKFNWNCSPVEKVGSNQAITEADPIIYDDDDIFGYMSARKVEVEGKKKPENVTVTRVSPLKCSPLIGLPIRVTSDFGVMNRDFEGDPVLYNHQFYSNILKGIFALDLDTAGTFTCINKPGSKNLSEDLVKRCEAQGMAVENSTKHYAVAADLKKKRVSETLAALKYLNGGAMHTLHLTEVTPKVIILAALNSGNNIFMGVFPHQDYEQGLINLDALNAVLEDYQDDLLSGVYIGILPGFGSENEKELMQFKAPARVTLTVTTPVKAIDGFIQEISGNDALFGA